MLEPRKSIHYFQVDPAGSQPLDGSTIVETPVSLTVNGDAWVSFMCTPVLLEAMAVGFLFNEASSLPCRRSRMSACASTGTTWMSG